jgi:hypothetical protein
MRELRDPRNSRERIETRTAIPAATLRYASRRVCFVICLVAVEVVCYRVISQSGKRSSKIRQGGHQSQVSFIHFKLFLCGNTLVAGGFL